MIHLYAFVPVRATTPDVLGIAGRGVRRLDGANLGALASDHDQAPSATMANALAHHEVVRTAATDVPTLPVRFGVRLGDDAALLSQMDSRSGELQAALHVVGGCVEYVVRPPAAPASPAAPPPILVPSSVGRTTDHDGQGRAYLEARLAEVRAEERAAASVHRRLGIVDGSLAALAAISVERSGPLGLERCYLVDRSEADRFVQVARETLGAAGDGLELSGPLPPYTFAETGGSS